MNHSRRYDKSAYKIGWICALPLELRAAVEILDEQHTPIPRDKSDHNIYEFGRVGNCNIIIASLPSGSYGTNSAASVAAHLRRSFPDISACLMVGIGGGAPVLPDNDIRLGDVVVSHPVPGYGGILQYDFGKTVQKGEFVHTGVLNKPPNIFLQAITKLKADCYPRPNFLDEAVKDLVARSSLVKVCPSPNSDRLFKAEYDHPVENRTCEECDPDKVIIRPLRPPERYIATHYGLIASGNQVMKHGLTRDRLSKSKGVLCFEMEAAGIADELGLLVIRGVCDYSDSHKNKEWQSYAALVAATYAKELLLRLAIQESPQDSNPTSEMNSYECLRELGATNPEDDKSKLELTKDQPIAELYSWIFTNQSFQEWNSDTGRPMLWISGGPGKGKSMLMIGIIDFLKSCKEATRRNQKPAIAYFFCQATDNRRNNAASVLKGLLYQLILHDQEQIFIKYLNDEFEKGGPGCFRGPNAFYVLQRVLIAILHNPAMQNFCFLVDALDECTGGLDELLHFISRTSELSGPSKSKWLVTSRNRLDIEEQLCAKDFQTRISLEDNQLHVSTAINTYVKEKVRHLSQIKHYTEETREQIEGILRERAGTTFLWIHLACKELAKAKAYNAVAKLKKIPSGLLEFYAEMLKSIQRSNTEEDVKLCHQILSVIILAVRPLSLLEMAIAAGLPRDMVEQELEHQVKQCGSFLVIQDGVVWFVHQTAKDFFDINTSDLFASSSNQNDLIARNCIQRLSDDLKMDICGLKQPNFSTPTLNLGHTQPIIHLQYACYYFVHHLGRSQAGGKNEIVLGFLREHLLHWIEVLILLGASSRIVSLIAELELTLSKTSEISEFFYEIRRFVRYNLVIIAKYPLQLYYSALVFTPDASMVKQLFLKTRPDWIQKVQGIDANWGPLVQTLHRNCCIRLMALSNDTKYLASTPSSSDDNVIAIWDVTSGIILKELIGHTDRVMELVFSLSGEELASVAKDSTIRVWKFSSGMSNCIFQAKAPAEQLRGLGQLYEYERSALIDGTLAFLADSRFLAHGLQDGSVEIWDLGCGDRPSSPRNKLYPPKSPKASPQGFGTLCIKGSRDGRLIASGTGGSLIYLWNLNSGTLIRQFKADLGTVCSINFSPDSQQLISASQSRRLNRINLWDISSGRLLNSHQHDSVVYDNKSTLFVKICRADFSHDASQIIFWTWQTITHGLTVSIWDPRSKKTRMALEKKIEGYPFALSANLTQLMISDETSGRNEIRQFDVSSLQATDFDSRTSEYTSRPTYVLDLVLSPNGRQIAYLKADVPIQRSGNHSLHLSYLDSGKEICLLSYKAVHISQPYNSLEFSVDGGLLIAHLAEGFWNGSRFGQKTRAQFLISSIYKQTVNFRLWDTSSGELLHLHLRSDEAIQAIAFSSSAKIATSQQLESNFENSILVWHAETVIERSAQVRPQLGFHTLSSLFQTRKVREHIRRLKGHHNTVCSLNFSSDGRQLVSVSIDHAVKVWDVLDGSLLWAQPAIKIDGYSPISAHFLESGRQISILSIFYFSFCDIYIYDIGSLGKYRRHTLQTFKIDYYQDGSEYFLRQNGRIMKLRPNYQDGGRHDRIFDPKALKEPVMANSWFSYNEEDLLYIPTEYRTTGLFLDIGSSESTNTVLFGNDAGLLVIMKMPPLP